MKSINKLIDENPISKLQYATIFTCFLMNMLDGMDVMIMSYTAVPISAEWNISPNNLGVVLSAGLFGMTIGTLFLAPFADKLGRKPIILMSGALMGIMVFLSSYSINITQLWFYRFISGLGIGCMLASTAALSAEYAPHRTKDFWVSFVIGGYALGALFSGLVAAEIIPKYGWQMMFKIAGICSLLSVPIVLLFLTESLDFYLRTKPASALEKANKILAAMSREPLESLPTIEKINEKIPVGRLLSPALKKTTLQLWVALFMAFAALYFLTGWIPKLAKDAGLSTSLAIYAGAVFNGGAFLGIISQGYISGKFGLKKTIGIILFLTSILMSCFYFFIGSDLILVIFALLGFGVQGGFVGLYSVAARLYDTEYRTTGLGWSMGAGRIGGIVGPIFAGILLSKGIGIGWNFLIFAIPALIAGYITYNLDSNKIS
jgi:MFS transporter, AAHS family, 4-hydroxybenzoate transporter